MQRFKNEADNRLYQELISKEHRVEYRLTVGESGVLVTEKGEQIIFGGDGDNIYDADSEDKILVADGGPDSGFGDWMIRDLKTRHTMFEEEEPNVGSVIAGEIDVTLNEIVGVIPRAARLAPYIRITSPDGSQKTKWLSKGVFYIDTRETSMDEDGLAVTTFHGYDALAKAVGDYPSTSDIGDEAIEPVNEKDVVRRIASELGVGIDARTWGVMVHNYEYGIPIGYSMGEILSYIGASYCGSWIITDTGLLRLVTLSGMPEETNLLMDHVGFIITFGEEPNEVVRILV